MSFNKIFLLGLAFLLLANIANAEDLKINFINPPAELKAGAYFNAIFEVQNLELTNITNIEFELVPGSSLAVEGDDTKKINILEPLKSAQLTYGVRVNTGALSGYRELKLKYSNGEKDSVTFNVFVSAIETNLVLNKVEQQEFIPGNKARLKINLENKASYSLKDIKIILDFTNTPFAPSGSSGEKTIPVLNGYNSEDVEFDLIALPNAEAGIYKIPIKIIYFDEFSRPYNLSNLISITISAYPFLDIVVDNNELIENQKSKVSIKFINRGLTGIKFLNIKLMESGSYNIVSADNYYIGSIDIDDYQTIDFELLPKTNGNINLPLMISYKDANNKDYITTLNLNSKVYSTEEAKQLGLIKSSNSFLFVIPVILLVFYLVYRKYKRRRK